MDKASSIYANQTVFFATKHGKDQIVAPLFQSIGVQCEKINVDTDQFGTFTGEIPRTGSVRETLRKKIQAAAEITPRGRLFLASEGSFGPDPFLGFLQTDLESVLLWDREFDLEIYAEYLCRSPIHDEVVLGPHDDFRHFLKKIHFPQHSVIVRPEGKLSPIFKGLKNEQAVCQAMLECFCHSESRRVILATDLRADQNATRRNAIARATQALIEKLQSLCPRCLMPGFSISKGIPGLKCAGCGMPSAVAQAVLFECVSCGHTAHKPRPDGRERLPIEECEHCNP